MQTDAELMQPGWQGGVSPFGIPWSKFMMWIFIVSDGIIFASFLAAYGFVRLASPMWPDRSLMFHINFIALMTFTLITSSATMATAVGAAKHGRMAAARLCILATIVGGLAFLGMQAYEWTSLIHEGATLTSNPWGPPLFAACFFIITGFHGTHVLSGVVILAISAIRSSLGRTRPEGVELVGLYWHFVDLVWVFIFTLFYLV